MEQLRIVPAVAADHPEMAVVWEASVRATHDFLSEEDIRFFRPLVEHEYLSQVSCWCARSGAGELLGFVGVAGERIEMLFLAPEHRGRGVGSALLRHAVETLGATAVDVNEQNPQALGFYEHMGFCVVGRSALDASGKPFPLLHMAYDPAR